MNPLLRAALAVADLNALRAGLRARLRRVAIIIAGGIAAGILGLAALIWLDAALWFYCVPMIGRPLAALVAAGGFILVILIIMVVVILTGPRRAERVPPPPVVQAAAPAAGAAFGEIGKLLRRNSTSILIAALVAGLVFGSSRRK